MTAQTAHKFLAIAAGAVLCVGVAAHAHAQCIGDCSGNSMVTVGEIVIGINIALGIAPASSCTAFDVDGDVTVNELVTAVHNALTGCPGGATPTLTPSPTPTQPTPATPTPTTPPATGCGDGSVDFQAGETCDDGNTVEGDACPATCRIAACPITSGTLDVDVGFTSPAGVDLAALTVFVRYPDGTVRIPGRANESSVQDRILNLPDNSFSTPNDLDYALRLVLLTPDSSAIPVGRLFSVSFDFCEGATAPPASAFQCTVENAGDTNNDPVTGATCTVTLP